MRSPRTNGRDQIPGRIIHFSAIAVLLLSLFSCSGPTSDVPTPSITPAPPKAITVALALAPVSLDPADHRTRATETVLRNMFDGLVTRDTRNQIHLELAEDIQWIDDQTLEIRLRDGVLFHDGVELTADDVVFTFERIIQEDAIEYPEPHTSPRKSLINPLERIEKIDDLTVRMVFSGPWPPALQLLVHQQILPKHYFEEVGTAGFLKNPIGTGPFQHVSHSEDLEEISLIRFDDYYGGSPTLPPVGPACLDTVTFRVIPDAKTRAAALRLGEVDIIQAIPVDLADELAEDPSIQVMTAPGTQPIWLELNVNHPLFDNLKERQALNFAIDKEQLIDDVFAGNAVALPGPLSPLNRFVSQSLEPYPYNPRKALNLLAQLGWNYAPSEELDDPARSIPEEAEMEGAPGNLRNLGVPYRFVIDTLPEFQSLAQAISAQLNQIGIEVDVRLWDPEIIRPLFINGERMAYLDDWGDSAFDPVGHFDAKWHGREEGTAYGRGNFSGYNNPRVNELITMAEVTADAELRQQLYDEAQAIIYEESPAVFLVLPNVIEAASTRVTNWQPASDGRINLHDVCIDETPAER